MSDYKMNYLPDEGDEQQQRDNEEREQYEQEYEQWLDELEKKSKLKREEQDDTNSKGTLAPTKKTLPCFSNQMERWVQRKRVSLH